MKFISNMTVLFLLCSNMAYASIGVGEDALEYVSSLTKFIDARKNQPGLEKERFRTRDALLLHALNTHDRNSLIPYTLEILTALDKGQFRISEVDLAGMYLRVDPDKFTMKLANPWHENTNERSSTCSH